TRRSVSRPTQTIHVDFLAMIGEFFKSLPSAFSFPRRRGRQRILHKPDFRTLSPFPALAAANVDRGVDDHRSGRTQGQLTYNPSVRIGPTAARVCRAKKALKGCTWFSIRPSTLAVSPYRKARFCRTRKSSARPLDG